MISCHILPTRKGRYIYIYIYIYIRIMEHQVRTKLSYNESKIHVWQSHNRCFQYDPEKKKHSMENKKCSPPSKTGAYLARSERLCLFVCLFVLSYWDSLLQILTTRTNCQSPILFESAERITWICSKKKKNK